MADKRKRTHDVDERGEKRQKRKGFVVGPDNLPDGTRKRKNQELKRNLIERAKIKQEYAKLKQRGDIPSAPETIPQPASLALDNLPPRTTTPTTEPIPEPDNVPHPDRQALIDSEEPNPPHLQRRQRQARPIPFQREHELALQRQAEAEQRRRAREEAEEERGRRIEEREKFRRAMAKARTGGKNGQRKLGRESQVLLERVKRIVGGAG